MKYATPSPSISISISLSFSLALLGAACQAQTPVLDVGTPAASEAVPAADSTPGPEAEPSAVPPVVIDEQAAAAHRKAGRKLAKAKDWAGAAVEFEAATQADPSSGRLACELGWTQFRAEHTDDARASLERGIALLGSDPALAKPLGACLYNLGHVAEAAGDLDAARAYYQRSLEARPGNDVVAQHLANLGEVTQEGSAKASNAALACKDGGKLELDLDTWLSEVEGYKGPPSGLDTQLAKLGLNAVSDEVFVDWFADEGDPVEPVEASTRTLDLRLGKLAAKAIQVTLTNDSGANADRVAVVLTRADQSRCVVGQIDYELDMCSISCLGDGPPLSLSKVALIAADVEALRVDTQWGACCGSERDALSASELYGIEDDTLASYLEVETYKTWYFAPTQSVQDHSATLVFEGDFPKQVRVESKVTCTYDCEDAELAQLQAARAAATDPTVIKQLDARLLDECGLHPEYDACKPSRSSARYSYQGGRYVEVE